MDGEKPPSDPNKNGTPLTKKLEGKAEGNGFEMKIHLQKAGQKWVVCEVNGEYHPCIPQFPT